jgi:hypothetical protein
MAVYSEVRTAIKRIAEQANNAYPTMPIIFSHTNGTEPSETYLVINILDIQQIGHHSTPGLTDPSLVLDARVSYEVMVQYSFQGSLAGDAVHDFTQKINNNPLMFEQLQKYKLGFMRKTQVRRAPQKRDTKWVENFNLDVTYSYVINSRQDVDTVEVVIIQDGLSGEVYTVPPDVEINP